MVKLRRQTIVWRASATSFAVCAQNSVSCLMRGSPYVEGDLNRVRGADPDSDVPHVQIDPSDEFGIRGRCHGRPRLEGASPARSTGAARVSSRLSPPPAGQEGDQNMQMGTSLSDRIITLKTSISVAATPMKSSSMAACSCGLRGRCRRVARGGTRVRRTRLDNDEGFPR